MIRFIGILIGLFATPLFAEQAMQLASRAMQLASTRHVRETVQGLASSPDGRTVGRALSDGVVLGTPEGGGQFLSGLDGDFLCVAMDASGRVLAAGDRKGVVWCWDVQRQMQLGRFAHRGPVAALRFGPDGRWLVSGGWDGRVVVWEVATGRALAEFAHRDEVYAVSVSPNGRWIASGSWDRQVKVWDAATGDLAGNLSGHRSGVTALDFSPDGSYLVSGDWDGRMKIWRVGAWQEAGVLDDRPRSRVTALGFGAGGMLVSGHGDGRLRLWDVEHRAVQHKEKAHPGGVTALGFSGGARVVSAGRDRRLTAWKFGREDRPPRIEMTHPSGAPLTTGESTVEVVGVVHDDTGVSRIVIQGEDILLSGTRGVEVVSRTRTTVPFRKSVALHPGMNRIRIVAQDRSGQQAIAEHVVVASQGRSFAVIIGIEDYEDPSIRDLEYAEADARGIYEVLTDPARGGIPRDQVRLLLGSEATRANIRAAIGDWLYRKAGPQDKVFFFYAGHGAVGPDRTGREDDGLAKYMVPYDARMDRLFVTAIPNKEMAALMETIQSEKMAFFLDSCYSGGITRSSRALAMAGVRAESIAGDAYVAFAGRGRAVLAASQPNQISLELGPPIGHGVFSYYLIEALNGSADANRDGAVDLLETVGYLSARVPEKVRQVGGKQEPLFDGRGITNPHLFVLAQNPINR